MDRAAFSRSSNAVVPAPASPLESGQIQSVFKPDAFDARNFQDDESGGLSSTSWGLKHLQWILALLATGMLVATAYASQRIYDLGETFKDIMGSLNLNSNSLNVVDRTVQLTLLVSWLLAGGAIVASAISIIWKFWNAAKRERFKHLAKDGEIDSRTAWMCFRFNALRALLTTVHVFCILACIWFVVMLCALVALLVLLLVGQKTADGALTFIQTAETNANKFAADIFVRIEEYEKDLEELTATITVYCALLGCPEVIDETQERMSALSEEMGGLLAAVEEAEVCPSASCINLDLFWFLEAKGCICASDTIQVVSSLGASAQRDCRTACIAVGVAYLCALLMLSKTAMNLNSHVNDDAWMRRVRRIFMKLQERGIRFPPNEAESGHLLGVAPSVASLNEFYNAVIPPKTQGMADSQRAPSVPGSPTKSPLTPQHQQSSHGRLKRRHYLGIEPPVSLGSDIGGSGTLSASGSKRPSRGPVDGPFGAALSTGSLVPAPSGLARENSAGSLTSGPPGSHVSTGGHSRRRSEEDGGSVGVGVAISRGRRGLGNSRDAAAMYAEGGNDSPPARGQGNKGFLGAVQSMCSCIDSRDGDGKDASVHTEGSDKGGISGDADSLGRRSGVGVHATVSTSEVLHADELPLPVLPGLLRSRSGKRLGFGSGGSGRLNAADSTGGMERGDAGGVFADTGFQIDGTPRSGGLSGDLATPTAGGNVELSIIHEARESEASLQSTHGSQYDRRASLVSMPEDPERENSAPMESTVSRAPSTSLSNTETLHSKSRILPESTAVGLTDSRNLPEIEAIEDAKGVAVAEGACMSRCDKPGIEGGSSVPLPNSQSESAADVTARTIVRAASFNVFAGAGERSQSNRALLKLKPAPNRRSYSSGLSGAGDAASSGASTPSKAAQSSIGASSSVDLRVPGGGGSVSGRAKAGSMRSMPSFGSWNIRNSFTMPWFGRGPGSRRHIEEETPGGASFDDLQFEPTHSEVHEDTDSAGMEGLSENSQPGNTQGSSEGLEGVAESGQNAGNPMETLQIERLETNSEHGQFADAPQASATAEGIHADHSDTSALILPESLLKHPLEVDVGPDGLQTLGFATGTENPLQAHDVGSEQYHGVSLAPLQPCAMMPACQLSWGAALLGRDDSPCTASIVPVTTTPPLQSPSGSGGSPKGSTGELNLPFLVPAHGENPSTPVATSGGVMHAGSPIAESLVNADEFGDTTANGDECTAFHRFAAPMGGYRRYMMHAATTPVVATGASHEGMHATRALTTHGNEMPIEYFHREELVAVEGHSMMPLETPLFGEPRVAMGPTTASTLASGDQVTPELMLEAVRRRSQVSGMLPAPSVWGPSGVSATLSRPDAGRSHLVLQRTDTEGTSALFHADGEDSFTSDML